MLDFLHRLKVSFRPILLVASPRASPTNTAGHAGLRILHPSYFPTLAIFDFYVASYVGH